MDRDKLMQFFKSTGYKTHNEVLENFKDENVEILEGYIEHLEKSYKIRKIQFKSVDGQSKYLYYVPY